MTNNILQNNISKRFKKTGVLSKDVKKFLEIHNCQDTIIHVENVANEAKTLAHRFSENEESAFVAGLLHDISAIFPDNKREKIAIELNINVLPEEKSHPNILHQKLSQVIAQEIFEITDQNILSAISCHTTLKKNASVLDKIVFIADKIKWDQDYKAPFLDDILQAMEISLDEACFAYLDYLWKQKDNLPVIHPWFLDAHKQLCSTLNK